MAKIIYLVRVEGNTTTSSWNETSKAFTQENAAVHHLEELVTKEIDDIEKGDHDGFRDKTYNIAFDENVPEDYSKDKTQTCIYNENTNDWVTIYIEEIGLE